MFGLFHNVDVTYLKRPTSSTKQEKESGKYADKQGSWARIRLDESREKARDCQQGWKGCTCYGYSSQMDE